MKYLSSDLNKQAKCKREPCESCGKLTRRRIEFTNNKKYPFCYQCDAEGVERIEVFE